MLCASDEVPGRRTSPHVTAWLMSRGVSGVGASLGRGLVAASSRGWPVDTSSLGGLVVHINLVPTGAERSGSEPDTDDRARRAPLALRILMAVGRWSVLAVGLAVSWHAAGWGGSGEGLDSVSVRHPYRGGLDATAWRWDLTALSVASIVLLTGASRWRRGRVNVAQVFGAAWLGLWTGFWVFLRYALQFPGGDEYDYDPCVREGCWPAGIQEPLAASPLLIASMTMIVVAVFAHRLNWVARALIPTSVYLVLRIVQILIWKPVVVPFLIGT